MKSKKTGFASYLLASLCLLALTGSAQAQSNWTTQMILNSTSIQAYGVNNNNVVTGDAGASFNTEQGYFWDNVNQLRIWPIFSAGGKSWYSNGRGINHLSPPVACGDARDTTAPTFNRAMAVKCPPDHTAVTAPNIFLLSNVGGLSTGESLATAINMHNDIVGTMRYSATVNSGAVVWHPSGSAWGNPVFLDTTTVRDSTAMDVEEREDPGNQSGTAFAVGWVTVGSLRQGFYSDINAASPSLSTFLPTSPSGYTWAEANGINRQRDMAGMAKVGSGGARHVMVRRSALGGLGGAFCFVLPIPAGWSEAYANDIGPRFTSSDGHQKVWICGTLVSPSGTNEAFAEIVDLSIINSPPTNGPIYTLSSASPGGFPNGTRYFGQAQGMNERGSDGFLRGYLPTIVGVGANNGGSFTYAVVARSAVDNYIDSGSIAIGSVSVGGTSTTGGSAIHGCHVTLHYEGGTDPIFEARTVSLGSSDPRITFYNASGQQINSVVISGASGQEQGGGQYISEEFWIGTPVTGSPFTAQISANVGAIGYLPDPNGWPVITVNPTPTSLTAPTPTTVVIGQSIQFTSTLTWSGGPISGANVSFTANSHTVNGTTNGSGVAVSSGMAIDESFVAGTPYQLVASLT